MREWTVEKRTSLFRHPIFELERQRLRAGEEHREALALNAPRWINVVPLLDDDRVVLVRQWRFGLGAPCLEIPGGMVDDDESPAEATRRELLEETGYRAGRVEQIGTMHPNPAFLTNRLTTWLATDLKLIDGDRRVYGVEGEEIEVETVPLAEIPGLIAGGTITHSLVIAAFYFLALRRPAGSGAP